MINNIVRIEDYSVQTYEKEWINQNENNLYTSNNPSLTFYTSMVFGFAKHLPYSIDIEQEEYVPADFYNMEPLDVNSNDFFKWDDRRTFFNSMINWNDTYKTGILLQICFIFQKMLLGQFPNNYELKESDYVGWGIDKMTNNKDYNHRFFEILKSLPIYYKNVTNAPTNDERRNCLDKMYEEIMLKISSKHGGFKETDSKGNIVTNSPSAIPIWPDQDVSMRVQWENVPFYDGISSIIKDIKKEQLKKYMMNKPVEIETSSIRKR